MEKITPPSSTVIPIVDLSPFIHGGNESSKKKVMKIISEACTNLGVFYIENHGVPLDKCEKLLELSNAFFKNHIELKENSTKEHVEMSGAGYGKILDKYHDYEYLLMYSPGIPYNGVPTNPPEYKETFEEVFKYLVKTSQILEEIINDCLNLPRDFLKKYNNDRSWDYMLPMHYTVAQENENIGIDQHEDPNFLTITLQDNVSGLQVYKDEWIPAIPARVLLTVVVSDLVQVLSNKIYKHVTHKAFKNKNSTRLAIDFCYNFAHHKWIEPLRLLPEEIGLKPKYRGFLYQDYIDLITEDYKHPPATVEDFINITYYEI